jgi:hypothetical protein
LDGELEDSGELGIAEASILPVDEVWEVRIVDCWVAERLDDELGAATEGMALLVENACVVELDAPKSKTPLVEDEGEMLKELEVDEDWAVELKAADRKAKVDVPIVEEEAASEAVELGAPAEKALLVEEVWDEGAAYWSVEERLDGWDKVVEAAPKATVRLVEEVWEVAAPDCKVEDDVPRVEEAAAPEDSVLKLVTEDPGNGDVTGLDAGALRPDELVWIVDWAAKMDAEENELQSVTDTVRVTVTAALVIWEV